MADESKLIGTELPIAILAKFPDRFQMHDPADLVAAIYASKKEGAYDEFFANYSFEDEGRVPYSPELCQALDNLQHTSFLKRDNPNLVNYNVPEVLKEYYRRYVKDRVSDETLLESLAEKVFAHVGEGYSSSAAQDA